MKMYQFKKNITKEDIDNLLQTNSNIDDLFDGETMLHYSVMQGKIEEAKYLIRLGANVNIKDNDLRTPIFYIMYCDENKSYDMAKLLLEHGADVTIKDKFGNNLISKFLYKNKYDVELYNNLFKLFLDYDFEKFYLTKGTFGGRTSIENALCMNLFQKNEYIANKYLDLFDFGSDQTIKIKRNLIDEDIKKCYHFEYGEIEKVFNYYKENIMPEELKCLNEGTRAYNFKKEYSKTPFGIKSYYIIRRRAPFYSKKYEFCISTKLIS